MQKRPDVNRQTSQAGNHPPQQYSSETFEYDRPSRCSNYNALNIQIDAEIEKTPITRVEDSNMTPFVCISSRMHFIRGRQRFKWARSSMTAEQQSGTFSVVSKMSLHDSPPHDRLLFRSRTSGHSYKDANRVRRSAEICVEKNSDNPIEVTMASSMAAGTKVLYCDWRRFLWEKFVLFSIVSFLLCLALVVDISDTFLLVWSNDADETLHWQYSFIGVLDRIERTIWKVWQSARMRHSQRLRFRGKCWRKRMIGRS